MVLLLLKTLLFNYMQWAYIFNCKVSTNFFRSTKASPSQTLLNSVSVTDADLKRKCSKLKGVKFKHQICDVYVLSLTVYRRYTSFKWIYNKSRKWKHNGTGHNFSHCQRERDDAHRCSCDDRWNDNCPHIQTRYSTASRTQHSHTLCTSVCLPVCQTTTLTCSCSP